MRSASVPRDSGTPGGSGGKRIPPVGRIEGGGGWFWARKSVFLLPFQRGSEEGAGARLAIGHHELDAGGGALVIGVFPYGGSRLIAPHLGPVATAPDEIMGRGSNSGNTSGGR